MVSKLKISILSIILATLAGSMNAQVGIGTANPEAAVHVGGDANSNIIVDGLNATNNTNNLGVESTTRVYVDSDGDLTLGSSVQNIEIVLDDGNYLPDFGQRVNQTGGGEAFTLLNQPNNIAFTLSKDAIVQINYSVSWSIEKNNSSLIDDERARIIQTGIYLRNAGNNIVTTDLNGNSINPGETCNTIYGDILNCLGTSALIGLSGQYYNNSSGNRGEGRGFHNTGSDYVRLPAGTYKAFFAIQVSVGDAGGSGNIQFEIGTHDDNIQIVAYYYN